MSTPKSGAHRSWFAMKARCKYATGNRFRYYGGRGITVCDRWLAFENFLADMGDRPAGATLERKNRNLGYSPDNCVWATQKEQQRNRSDNRLITAAGVTRTLADWAEHLGCCHATIQKRIDDRGWPEDLAVTTPVRRCKRASSISAAT